MDHIVDNILSVLYKSYPQDDKAIKISNVAYQNHSLKTRIAYQYILDVAPNDPMTNGVNHYEYNLKNEFGPRNPVSIKTLPWPFYEYEENEAKQLMIQLAAELNIQNLDVEKAFAKLKIKKDDDRIFSIVITVVEYNVVYID